MKPYAEDAVRRGAVVAERRPAEARLAVPSAAPTQTIRASRRPTRVGLRTARIGSTRANVKS